MTHHHATTALALAVLAAGAHAQNFFAGGTTLTFGAPPGSSVRDFTTNANETLAVFASDRPGGPGGWDLWLVRRPTAGAPWGAPLLLPFNTPADEVDPGFSPDGNELYFASNRAGGPGGFSIYLSQWVAPLPPFGPAALVPAINGAFDTTGPQVTDDGRRLLYSSKQSGGGDLYMVFRASPGSPWGAPVALEAINDPTAEDYDPAPDAAGSIVWFSSRRPGGAGGADFYVSWRDARTGVWATPLAVSELNTTGDEEGLHVSAASGITYHNGLSLPDITVECICRNGPSGGDQGGGNGWVEGSSSAAWPTPVLFTKGANWQMGAQASLSFYDWMSTGPIFVTAISAARLPAPVVLPFITLGAIEIDPTVWLFLPPTTANPFGYGRLTFAVPNRPSLAGQNLWIQTFAATPGVGVEMTPPERITLR